MRGEGDVPAPRRAAVVLRDVHVPQQRAGLTDDADRVLLLQVGLEGVVHQAEIRVATRAACASACAIVLMT